MRNSSLLLAALCIGFSPLFAQDWNLVWSDEFDTPGLPDPTKWGYDVGGGGWGNQELQYYTNAREENASVANGVLSITARRENFENREYTSARLVSRNKGDWLYGRVEVRAKLPRGRGMWSAIWMLPTDWEYGNWPASGELDIMENVGYDSTQVHCNIHTQDYHHSIGTNKGAALTVNDPWDTWHVYRMDWYPDSVRYTIDDRHVFSFAKENTGYTTWPFDKRFHLILNIAVGGSWGGAQGIDNSRFPQAMEVDWVRVYQTDDSPIVDPIPPPAGEMIWNGDFTQGSLRWERVGAYEGAVADGAVDGESYRVQVTSPGSADWHVQFSQVGMNFVQGNTYRITFDARASIDRAIAVAANENADPWTTYHKERFALTTQMQTYSTTFTMEQATDAAARIEFDLGGTAATVWLDNVSVRMEEPTTPILPLLPRAPGLSESLQLYDLLGRQ